MFDEDPATPSIISSPSTYCTSESHTCSQGSSSTGATKYARRTESLSMYSSNKFEVDKRSLNVEKDALLCPAPCVLWDEGTVLHHQV